MTVSISVEQYDAWQAAAQLLVAKRDVIGTALVASNSDESYLCRELLSDALAKLDRLTPAPISYHPPIDEKATARGEVMRLHHMIAHYNARALYHEDATKREVATAMVVQLARRLNEYAQKAGL